jgi:hypothetical protein
VLSRKGVHANARKQERAGAATTTTRRSDLG